jgi:alginate O-acetyltransferase complex protein AlgI
MLFVQFRFLIFFLIVFSVHWLLQTNRSRKIWLLCASHFFFACFFIGGADNPAPEQFPPYTFFSRLFSGQSLPVGWWYPVVMWVTTTLDYFVGRKLAVTDDAAGRVRWLLLSLCANLGVLAFFKYANFGLGSAAAVLAGVGGPARGWPRPRPSLRGSGFPRANGRSRSFSRRALAFTPFNRCPTRSMSIGVVWSR